MKIENPRLSHYLTFVTVTASLHHQSLLSLQQEEARLGEREREGRERERNGRESRAGV